jgi:uncharacterized protein (DUF58 family)
MTFPLIPQGRLIGLSFGTMRSFRRGRGSDVVGSRPYQVGDDVHAIDWAASARYSAARQSDEFIVRERYAEEAPRVVIVCDRRPEMSFYATPLPWLDKPRAQREGADLILRSAVLAGGFIGYVDQADGTAYWEPPRGGRKLRDRMLDRLSSTAFGAPPNTVAEAIAHLAEHRLSVPAGTFVFVLSDFLPPPARSAWRPALERHWDLVPVVIQDPTWEQSFPRVDGIGVRVREPRTGKLAELLLTAQGAATRRAANEERLARLLDDFHALGLDPVVVASSEPAEVLASFLAWSEARRARRVA